MTDIYLDENHDITLLNGDLRLTTSDEDLVQRLSIHLQFLLDEWFLDTSQGIPYTQTIFESNYNNIDSIYTLLRTEIKNIEGVEIINELEIDLNRDSRTMSVVLKVNGDTELEVII